MAKKTKEEVDYSKGMPQSHCGICRHFREPSSCTLVAGKINPEYWCKLFEKNKARAR